MGPTEEALVMERLSNPISHAVSTPGAQNIHILLTAPGWFYSIIINPPPPLFLAQ